MPRGWVYQNMVVCANLHQLVTGSLDRAGQEVVPHKMDAVWPAVNRVVSHRSIFNLLAAIAIPNFARASQTLAYNQTLANQAQIVCARSNAAAWRAAGTPTRWRRSRRSSSKKFRATSSAASRPIIAAPKTGNFFSTPSAGRKPTTAVKARPM